MTTSPAATRPLPAPAAPAPAPSSGDWRGAFQDLPREHGFEPLRVEGALPGDLRGTLYRNGPGLLTNHGRRYVHLFDGDGGVSAVRFDGRAAAGAVRVVESRGLREERRAGRKLHGGFGEVQRGLLKRLRGEFKNAANTSVLPWQGRLFALWEAGLPTELSPDDLSTVGETDLGGAIPKTFSAHPTYVASRRAWYNFGARFGRKNALDLFELPIGGGKARCLGAVPLSGPTMVHDFAATDRHLVVFAPPLRMRVLSAMLGLTSFGESLAWRPELGTEVLVIPIDDPRATVRFTIDPFYQWHFTNAFERESGEVVVDLVRYRAYTPDLRLADLLDSDGAWPLDGTYHRMVVDPRARKARTEQRWDRACEFPRVAPAVEGREHRFAYVSTHQAGPIQRHYDAIAKIEVESGRVTEVSFGGRTVSEPVFVPRPGGGAEDDGYLLVHLYDPSSHTTSAAVLDARDLERGPLAEAHFDHHIPTTFHGNWAGA